MRALECDSHFDPHGEIHLVTIPIACTSLVEDLIRIHHSAYTSGKRVDLRYAYGSLLWTVFDRIVLAFAASDNEAADLMLLPYLEVLCSSIFDGVPPDTVSFYNTQLLRILEAAAEQTGLSAGRNPSQRADALRQSIDYWQRAYSHNNLTLRPLEEAVLYAVDGRMWATCCRLVQEPLSHYVQQITSKKGDLSTFPLGSIFWLSYILSYCDHFRLQEAAELAAAAPQQQPSPICPPCAPGAAAPQQQPSPICPPCAPCAAAPQQQPSPICPPCAPGSWCGGHYERTCVQHPDSMGAPSAHAELARSVWDRYETLAEQSDVSQFTGVGIPAGWEVPVLTRQPTTSEFSALAALRRPFVVRYGGDAVGNDLLTRSMTAGKRAAADVGIGRLLCDVDAYILHPHDENAWACRGKHAQPDVVGEPSRLYSDRTAPPSAARVRAAKLYFTAGEGRTSRAVGSAPVKLSSVHDKSCAFECKRGLVGKRGANVLTNYGWTVHKWTLEYLLDKLCPTVRKERRKHKDMPKQCELLVRSRASVLAAEPHASDGGPFRLLGFRREFADWREFLRYSTDPSRNHDVLPAPPANRSLLDDWRSCRDRTRRSSCPVDIPFDNRDQFDDRDYYTSVQRGGDIYAPLWSSIKDDFPVPRFTRGRKLSLINVWFSSNIKSGFFSNGAHSDAFDNTFFVLKGYKRWRIMAPVDVPRIYTISPVVEVSPSGVVRYAIGTARTSYPFYSRVPEMPLGLVFDKMFTNASAMSQCEARPGVRESICPTYMEKHEWRRISERFPKLQQTSPTEVLVAEGDMIFLPAGWMHEVLSAGLQTTAISMWYTPVAGDPMA